MNAATFAGFHETICPRELVAEYQTSPTKLQANLNLLRDTRQRL
jgi:hypothetical protein